MESNYEVAIIGGGFAGLSAGLMLARARRRVVVVDGGAPRNRFAAHMHGVLGHDGKPPLELIATGRREIERYGGTIIDGRVAGVARNCDSFTLTLANGSAIEARRLVVATGLRDELPEIEGLTEQWGKGVVACPYCDGFEVADQRIGVVATGPASIEQAKLVRQWSDRVTYFVHRAGTPAADDERALRARGIQVEHDRVVKVVSSNGRLTGVQLEGGRFIDLDAIFIAPTFVANDDVLRSLGAKTVETPFGEFVPTDQMGKTSVAGVWSVGNVVNPAANVPISIGAGALTGHAVNADLIAYEIATALEGVRPV